MTRRYLVAESETVEEREARRDSAGKSSGESYAATLRQLEPDADVVIVAPADAEPAPMTADALAAFDAVFLTGSPLHVYDDTPEVERQVAFMRAVFASGTPSFGSCAGLQVAVAAAGGKVRKMPQRMEAGIARRIHATDKGRDHPLLAGRPPCWDAPAIHGDEVEALPDDAILLASNGATRVQAAEIRSGRGIFWGVQYHPELAPGEIAAALERQAKELVAAGLAENAAAVERYAAELTALHRRPDSRPSRWMLGVDEEFVDEGRRRTELRNFLAHAPRLKNESRRLT